MNPSRSFRSLTSDRGAACVLVPSFAPAILLVLAVLVLPAAAQQNAAAPATRRVTAETAARAGLTRVDDLFWLLDGWTASSLDGYTVRPSATGLPGAPLLVIGGVPLAGGPFGRPPLPVLPAHLAQVRAAEATAAPQFVAGRLAPDGAVRLRLRRPPPGLAAKGAFSAGNEVGDPGPFRATERNVVNVDRIGPQYFAETSLRGARGSAALSLRAVRHYTTDRVIRRRTEHASGGQDGPPLQQLLAPRLTLSTGRRVPGAHRVTAHYAALRALPFFQTLGYEVPARRAHAQIAARGAFPSFSKRAGRLRYRLGYRRATLTSDPDRFRDPERSDLAFDWTEDRLSGHAAWEGAGLPLGTRLDLGLSADYTKGHAAGALLTDPDLLTTRAYASWAAPSTPARLTLLLSHTDGQFGGGALLSSRLPLENGSSGETDQWLGLRFAYLRRPYAADGSFWYWLRQGLPAPRAPNGRIVLPRSFSTSDRFTADARLHQSLPGGGHLAVEAGVKHFRQLTLPLADFGFASLSQPAFAPPGGILTPHTRLLTDGSGQTFRVVFEGERAFPKGLRHRLRYDFFAHHSTGDPSSRRAFDQRFQPTPRHRLRYTARLAVVDRFSMESRLALRSPERWPAYRRAARAEGSPYRARLPTRLRVNLTATKRFWRDHLRLRVTLRNLLDAPLRTHPAGPVRRLTLFVSFEAQL